MVSIWSKIVAVFTSLLITVGIYTNPTETIPVQPEPNTVVEEMDKTLPTQTTDEKLPIQIAGDSIKVDEVQWAFVVNNTPVTSVPSANSEWAIRITIPSLQSGGLVFSTEDWMESPSVYEKQLLNLRNNLLNSKSADIARWNQIIASGEADNVIAQIRVEILQIDGPLGERKQASSSKTLFEGLLRDNAQIWGMLGKTATPEQLKVLEPLWESLISISEAKLFILDRHVQVKQKLIAAIDSNDIENILVAERDDKTMELIYSWHVDGYNKLNDKELALKKGFGLPN